MKSGLTDLGEPSQLKVVLYIVKKPVSRLPTLHQHCKYAWQPRVVKENQFQKQFSEISIWLRGGFGVPKTMIKYQQLSDKLYNRAGRNEKGKKFLIQYIAGKMCRSKSRKGQWTFVTDKEWGIWVTLYTFDWFQHRFNLKVAWIRTLILSNIFGHSDSLFQRIKIKSFKVWR